MPLGTKCTWNVFLWKFNGSRLQAEESAGGTAIFNVRMEFFFSKGKEFLLTGILSACEKQKQMLLLPQDNEVGDEDLRSSS